MALHCGVSLCTAPGATGGWSVHDDGPRLGAAAPGSSRQRAGVGGLRHIYTEERDPVLQPSLPAHASHALSGKRSLKREGGERMGHSYWG